jgi:conjugative relaxase-like TrwC/TraI family protein
VLSIDKPGKGSSSSAYYWDYYNLECSEAAEMFGTGAELFHLHGEPERVHFENFRAGRTPYGEVDLVRNAGHPDRDTHWDLTFSAPKSVSILYALGTDDVRRQVVEAHKCAVREGLKYIEEHAAITRRGKGGSIREHAGIVGTFFTHDASREHDMQLHSHAVVMNIGIRPDGSTGALHSVELFRHKIAGGQVYQDALARELTQRLGIVTEKEKVGFHIQGVPKELCRENSTRRQQIEAEMKAQGFEGAAAAKKVAEDTRVTKRVLNPEVLFAKWHQTCEAFGWGQKEAAQLIEAARQRKENTADKSQSQPVSEKKGEQSRQEEKKEARAENQHRNAEKSGGVAKQPTRSEGRKQKRGHPLIGSWAGDRIAFIGDYAEPEDIPTCDARLIYQQFAAVIRGSDVIEFQAPAGWSEWSNISAQVREMMTAEYGVTYFGDDWLEIDPPPGELDR